MTNTQLFKFFGVCISIIISLMVIIYFAIGYINQDVVTSIYSTRYDYSQEIQELIKRDNPEIVSINVRIDKVLNIVDSKGKKSHDFHGLILTDIKKDIQYMYIHVGGKYGGPAITRYWNSK